MGQVACKAGRQDRARQREEGSERKATRPEKAGEDKRPGTAVIRCQETGAARGKRRGAWRGQQGGEGRITVEGEVAKGERGEGKGKEGGGRADRGGQENRRQWYLGCTWSVAACDAKSSCQSSSREMWDVSAGIAGCRVHDRSRGSAVGCAAVEIISSVFS